VGDTNIDLRLKRVEGQIRGLQRMTDEGAKCEEVLTQLLAARSALDQVGLLIIRNYVDHCLLSGNEAEMHENVRKIFSLVLTRYSLTPIPEESPVSPPLT
jgi:CsoR family transcriptional regulator, copper-sensing transcriptional repressor